MRINNLIARFLVNKTTKEEWDTLESWKQESQENLNELLEMQSIWQDSVDLKNYKNFNKSSAWDAINSQLDEDEPSQVMIAEPKKAKVINLKWALGVAASVAILVFSLFIFNTGAPEGYSHISSADVIESFALPDGSEIVMNRNSSMDFVTDFKKQRNVILDGEAYFQVERDEQHPFEIETDEGKVTVLGTSFNIIEKKNFVDIYVTSGKVRVSTEEESLELTKDDIVRCQDGKITRLDKPGRNYLSWTSSKLIFEETPLHKVVQDLSRHYNHRIVFSGESQAMNQPVTDTFEKEDFESVLETLVLITGIKYIKEGNTYIIQ